MSRPFLETLRELRAGATLDELASAVAEVVAAVKCSNKPGEIRLTLKFKPPKKGDVTYITVEDQVTVKAPRLDRGDTVFFPLADNSLSRANPAQRSLELQVIEADPKATSTAQSEALAAGLAAAAEGSSNGQ